MKERVPISYDQFQSVSMACAQTLSKTARPAINEASYTYYCTFGQFVTSDVYPVWYVDAARTRLLQYNDPQAQPILISELASLQNLVADKLSSWYDPKLGPIATASFITLYCTGCNRRVLIDGVHHALWLATHGGQRILVHVTELAGSQWPPETPDLNVVCACRA